MSKRTRHTDNSKRQQPIQQQRAQARLPGRSSASPQEGKPQQSPQNDRSGKQASR